MGVVIGWLADDLGLIGGSELSHVALKKAKPEWVERIIVCPPNRRPPEVDMFVVQNSGLYGSRWIEELSKKLVVKVVRGQQHYGSIALRLWLLNKAELLIVPRYDFKEWYKFDYTVPTVVVPPPVNLARFRSCRQEEREGNVWVGRISPAKGLHRSISLCLKNDWSLDVYGREHARYFYGDELPQTIRFHGEVPYHQLPAIFGKAQRFLFHPVSPEAFARTIVEAWAAGCELFLGGDSSAPWWIENAPEKLETAAEDFWEAVYEAI